MLTEDNYLEIKDSCAKAIDAIDDAIALCKRFLPSEKWPLENYKRARTKLEEVDDMCKTASDNFTPPSLFPIREPKCSDEEFIELVRYKYDMEDELERYEDEDELDEEDTAYELLGGIAFAAEKEVGHIKEIVEYSEDDNAASFSTILEDALIDLG